MITYEDKVALYENAYIANINKVTAGDMNEIKKSVNGIVESNIFKNLFNVGNAKITTNTGLNFNQTNNQILINGSSTTGTNILLDSPSGNKDKEGIILKAGTYTATIKKVSGSLSDGNIDFYLRKSNGNSIYDGTMVWGQKILGGVLDDTVYSNTFTLEEETRLHWIGYFGSDLRTFNNLVLQFQIEESPTPTSYIPWAGYIVESGSNDNGRWIKYSDGTLVQYGEVTETLNIATKNNKTEWYYEDGHIINFPILFADINYFMDVNAALSVLITLNVYSITSQENSKCKFNLSSNIEYNNSNYKFRWFAIGRWK